MAREPCASDPRLVSRPGFAQLRANRERGIQRGEGALQNNAHFPAANLPKFFFRTLENILALEKYFASDAAPFQGKESHQG